MYKNLTVDRLLKNQTNNTLIQLFRYTFVGGFAFIVDFSLLVILTEFCGVHYLISTAIALTIGLSINYCLSVIWVFDKRKLANKSIEFTLFAIIGIIGLDLNELFIWLFTEFAGFHYLISKIISTAIIYLWNFFARKFILFN
ncbi:MAG: GtrA family protein [Calditrichales bacterium]|nr:GtrA family protein [Calditrichales bacterium]